MVKRILSGVAKLVLIAPVFAIFNEDPEHLWVNVLALAYCILMCRYGKKIMSIM